MKNIWLILLAVCIFFSLASCRYKNELKKTEFNSETQSLETTEKRIVTYTIVGDYSSNETTDENDNEGCPPPMYEFQLEYDEYLRLRKLYPLTEDFNDYLIRERLKDENFGR